jgi:hypothetical protein
MAMVPGAVIVESSHARGNAGGTARAAVGARSGDSVGR